MEPKLLETLREPVFHGTRLWREGSATEEVQGGNRHDPRGQMLGPHGAYPLPPRCSDVVDLRLDCHGDDFQGRPRAEPSAG
jgi:hypothetical protein